MNSDFHAGMGRHAFFRKARKLGVIVTQINASGHIRIEHPLFTKHIVMHSTRHDVSYALISWIRKVESCMFDNEIGSEYGPMKA